MDIKQALENIVEKLHSIDKNVALNTKDLAEHMRRTENIERELGPVVKHVQQMQGAGKLLALLALIATILMILPLFK